MPTAKDITALRKAGQLAEAFALGMELLAAEPTNIWTKRAMGWVRFERLKAVAKSNKPNEFAAEWVAISELVADNPADETMLTNQALWQGISCLFSLGEADKAGPVLSAIFTSAQAWTVEKPSDVYSALLRAFLKAGKTWAGLGDFLQWWQLSNLRPEDCLPALTEKGEKIMAVAEQAYIALAKQVLKQPEPTVVQALITDLEALHEQHPEYQYPPYYLAKLLVAKGSKAEGLTALMPFARRKQREFWIWDTLADLYADEPEKAVACLCRAVSSQTQEKFLVKARFDLARKLSQAGKLNEALTELNKTVITRQSEGWKVEQTLWDGIEKLTQKGAKLLPDNKALYRHYRAITDDLLFADVPEQIGVVQFLNDDKKVAHFSVNRATSGHFKYEGSMSQVQPGDFVALRLEERTGKDGTYWVPLSVKRTDQTPSEEVFRPFAGTLKRIDGKEFGFVEDVFISPALLKTMTDAKTLTGSALWAHDKLKNIHGWRAFRVAG